MPRYVVLLRAINLGATRKVPMARLREVLAEAGFDDVATYLQSGNVALDATGSAAQVASRVREAIEGEWGFEVPVIVRTRARLAKVVEADPLGDAVDDPKRYQVTFLDSKPDAAAFSKLDESGWGDSRFALVGSELYTWTPAGVQSDRMLRDLARAHAGIDGTARNWRTVRALLELAGG